MLRTIFMAVAISLLVVFGTLVVMARQGRIPSQWNPWAPLRLDETPNFLTRLKLDHASRNGVVCLKTLAQAGWDFAAIDDETLAPGCGYRNAVRIERMQSTVGDPFTVSCREGLSLALWERHVLQPAALRHFGARVYGIEHFGSYSCRSVYGRPNARMSNHATADALDIAGFVIDGRRVRIVSAWRDGGPGGRFLQEVHEGACGFFDSVLGPDYNVAHRDHFHLDRGAFRICR